MKKATLLILLLALIIPSFSQGLFTVSGTVSDSITGAPIDDHEVIVFSDSSSGFFYYNTVETDDDGFYSDSEMVQSSGTMFVRIFDCNGQMHQTALSYSDSNLTFQQNFEICDEDSPCEAEFSHQHSGYLTVSFFDNSSGNNITWQWVFGDGSTSSLQNPVHTYSASGTYMVTLTIGDSASVCSDSETEDVEVEDSSYSECQAGFEAEQEENYLLTIEFEDESDGEIVSWYWDFGDGQFSQEEDPTHTYSQPGWYNVCLTIQGVDSLCFDTYCDSMFVGNGGGGCQAQFTYYPDSVPSGGFTFQFMDLSVGTPTSWYWDFGDSTFSTEQNPQHTFPGEGEYYVCLTIQCSGTTSTWCNEVEIECGSNCTNYFTYTQNGLTVTFSGFMVNGFPAEFEWEFGDGHSAEGQQQTHTYVAPGMYYVTLSTEDSTDCEYTSSQTIMVGDSAQFYQVYGQVLAGNFPLGLGLVMIFSFDTSGNYYPYIDVSMVDSNGVYYFSMVPNGNYYIYAIPFDTGGYLPTYYGDVLFWTEATIVTLPQPNNPYDIHLVPAGLLIPGPGNINGQINTGDFIAGMIDKITMMLMDESSNVISFSEVDAGGVFQFPQVGYGTYYLHAEMAGCTSDLITVVVTEQNPDVNVVLTFAGGHILGVNDHTLALDAGVVYPNPVREEANINVNTAKQTVLTAEVIDLTGRSVRKVTEAVTAGNHRITIPVSGLPAGIYTLRIFSGEGLSAAKKMVISR
jgi:PKD repeat protein